MLRCLVAALPLLTGCKAPGDAERPPEPAVAVRPPVIEELPDSTPPEAAVNIYYGAQGTAMARRGSLLDSTVTPVQNIHDTTQVDTLVLYRYHNAVARYLRFPAGTRPPMFVSVTLTASIDGLPWGIGVGSSDSLVLARFGSPAFDDTSDGIRTIGYSVGEVAWDEIHSRLKENRVFEVEWLPYID